MAHVTHIRQQRAESRARTRKKTFRQTAQRCRIPIKSAFQLRVVTENKHKLLSLRWNEEETGIVSMGFSSSSSTLSQNARG